MAKYLFRDIVIDSRTGLNPRQNFKLGNGNNYYITIKDIHNGRIEITDKTDRIDDDAVAKIKKRSRIKNGDILFTSIGRIGETAIVYDKNDTWEVNESIFIFTINREIIDAEYFCILLQSAELQERLAKDSSGSTFKSIKMNQLEKLSFDLPSLEKQRRIAVNINKVSNLIDLCNAILEKLDLLVKSRFVEMFGEPVSNPMGWEKVAIGKRCDIVTGNTPPRADAENYGEYIEWIKSDNINTPDTFLTTAEEYLSEKGASIGRCVDAGSVLMTCIAGSIKCIGNVGVADRKVAFNQQINAIVPKADDTMYIYWLMILSKPYIQSTINMALKGILSKGQLSEMVFPFPPLSLQEQFATFVKQTDKSKLAVKQVLEKAETLKKALMQEYFG